MSEGPDFTGALLSPQPEHKPKRCKWFAPAIVFFICFVVASISGTIAAHDRDIARAVVADLRQKLEEQTNGQNKCLNENSQLLSRDIRASMLLSRAADYLSMCAQFMPDGRLPKPSRKAPNFHLDGEVLPPQ